MSLGGWFQTWLDKSLPLPRNTKVSILPPKVKTWPHEMQKKTNWWAQAEVLFCCCWFYQVFQRGAARIMRWFVMSQSFGQGLAEDFEWSSKSLFPTWADVMNPRCWRSLKGFPNEHQLPFTIVDRCWQATFRDFALWECCSWSSCQRHIGWPDVAGPRQVSMNVPCLLNQLCICIVQSCTV